MEENTYYMTTCDSIYGMMRKSFIYVTKIRQKTFVYKFINDWQIIEAGVKLKINKIETRNYIGKLDDAECFKKLDKKTLNINFCSNCS